MGQTKSYGLAVLVVLLVLGVVSCGSPADRPDTRSTLEVASVPAADMWIDGEWKGSTPISISVAAGTHEVTLRQTGFAEVKKTVQTEPAGHTMLEETLIASDMEDPTVIASLARAFDVTVEPFEAPDQHRGGRSAAIATLLWPQQDVRPEGLDTFGIEVSEQYEADGYLVFRKGRKILYKERFDPEELTTVATIPLQVLQEVDVGDTVTWGIDFDSRRKKDVEARFKLVNRPKADRQLSKIATDRHLARQPALTRAMIRAKALENYRLYSEALVSYLEIAQENATSSQPYQGIVTTLRRLDGDESRLWGVASQFVGGAGRARAGRTGITAFAPQSARPLPALLPARSPTLAGSPTKPLGPGDAVATGSSANQPASGGTSAKAGASPQGTAPPTTGSTPSSASAGTPPSPTPGAAGRGDAALLREKAAQAAQTAAELSQQAARMKAEAGEQQHVAETATQAATEAEQRVEEAQNALDMAQQAANEDPTPEKEAALDSARNSLADAERERDEAADAAVAANAAAQQARKNAEVAAAEAKQLENQAAEAQRLAEQAAGSQPDAAGPGGKLPSAEKKPADGPDANVRNDLGTRVHDAEQALSDARMAAEEAQRMLDENPEDPQLQEEAATANAARDAADQEYRNRLQEYHDILGEDYGTK